MALLLLTAAGVPLSPKEPVAPQQTLRVGVCRLDDVPVQVDAAPPPPAAEDLLCEQDAPAILDCTDPLMSLFVVRPPGRCDMQRVGHPRARLHAQGTWPTARELAVLLLSPGRGHYALHLASTPPDHGQGDGRHLLPATAIGLPPRGAPADTVSETPLPPLHPGYPLGLLRPPR